MCLLVNLAINTYSEPVIQAYPRAVDVYACIQIMLISRDIYRVYREAIWKFETENSLEQAEAT